MTNTHRFLSLLLPLFIVVLQACGGGRTAGSEPGSTSPTTTATIDSHAGGTVSVRGTGTALDGLAISIPPGAFASPQVTITIQATPALPAPLTTRALSTGLVQASAVASIEATESGRFRERLTVTFPYDPARVSENEFPMVAHFDAALGAYQFLATTGVDRVARTVTFETDHFSIFTVFAIPELLAALQGLLPFPESLSRISAREFTPVRDGFPVQNFSTAGTDIGTEGICYGQAAYAAYYYARHALFGGERLFSKYKSVKSGSQSLPQLDDRAREVSYAAFAGTLFANQVGGPPLLPLPINDVETAAMLITDLAVFGLPLVVSLQQNKSYATPGFAHTVVVYEWASATRSFKIYDPNYPFDPALPGAFEQALVFGPDANFERYDDRTYGWVIFVPMSQVLAATQLGAVHDLGEGRSTAPRQFETIRVVAPAPVDDGSGKLSVPLDSTLAATRITFEWTPRSGPETEVSYAHVYLDGSDQPENGGLAPVSIEAGADQQHPRRFDVLVPTRASPHVSLEVAISTAWRKDADYPALGLLPQQAVSERYKGFVRVPLTTVTCSSLAGNWVYAGKGSTVCDGSFVRFDSQSDTTIPITMYQQGCTASLLQSFPADQRITINGNTANASGAIQFSPSNAVFSENQWTSVGAIDPVGRRVDWTTIGHAAGTIDGAPGSCSMTGTVAWSR